MMMNPFKKYNFKKTSNYVSKLEFEITKRGKITFDDMDLAINVAKALVKHTDKTWIYSCDFTIDPERYYDEVKEKYVNKNETQDLEWTRENFELSTGRKYHFKTDDKEYTWLQITSHDNFMDFYGQAIPDKLHALLYDHLKEAM